MKDIIVDSDAGGGRLDKFLKRYFAAATSSFLYKMLRKKNITLNGARANGNEILQDGDHIRVFFSDETFEKMRGSNDAFILFSMLSKGSLEPVRILYENRDIIAADKPAGLCSMPAENTSENANDKIISYLISKGELTVESYSVFHPSVANRLDRNTSGIILFGKTIKGLRELSEDIRERRIKKYYRCIVHGRVDQHMLLKAWWKKDTSSNTAIIKDEKFAGAKEIITEVFPVTAGDDISLVDLLLHTGRSHQIRAHMSHIGHPLLFDPKYGDRSSDKRITERTGKKSRYQLLHCSKVILASGQEIIAPVPALYEEIMKRV